MRKTIDQPEEMQLGPPPCGRGRWMVMIYDNPTNTFEEVISVLVRATMCTSDEAYMETWEAHTYGKAPVHFSNQRDCVEVAGIIGAIGVKTEVRPEWTD